MSEVSSETVVGVDAGSRHPDVSLGVPSTIKLVAEPEAPALWIPYGEAEDDTLIVNDTFIVCDVGGGIVNLISYEVQQLDPLIIKERTIGDAGLCSSMFLDPRFQKSIQTIVGEALPNTVKKSKRKKTNGFDYGIKRTSSERNGQVYSVDLAGVKRGSKTGVGDDNTTTVTIDAVRVVIDQISLQIEKSLRKQMAHVSDKGSSVKSIMLVGGFGENRYLCLDRSTLLILDLHIPRAEP